MKRTKKVKAMIDSDKLRKVIYYRVKEETFEKFNENFISYLTRNHGCITIYCL